MPKRQQDCGNKVNSEQKIGNVSEISVLNKDLVVVAPEYTQSLGNVNQLIFKRTQLQLLNPERTCNLR